MVAKKNEICHNSAYWFRHFKDADTQKHWPGIFDHPVYDTLTMQISVNMGDFNT